MKINVEDSTMELGLGFGGGAETGYSSRYDDDFDRLSYIDEKLEDVLGHFRKSFESDLSAENLGPIFGAYGSFLPVYIRYPDKKRPRILQNMHSSNKPNQQVEGLQTNSQVPSSASLLPSSTSTSATVASTGPLKDSSKVSERPLKFRIKVGSRPTQKNAEIYNNLTSRKSLNPSDESPANILQIMTSFPVKDNLLLSPLPHDLLSLSEKKRSHGESKPDVKQLPALSGGASRHSISDASIFDRKEKGVKNVSALTNRLVPVSYSGKNKLQTSIKHIEKKKLQEQKPGRGEIKRKRDADLGRLNVSKKAKVDDDRPSGDEKESKSSMTDVTLPDDTLKVLKQSGKPEKNQPAISAHHDSTTQAAGYMALKEGRILKYMADDMKNSGSDAEGTSLYFRAVLRFLHAAALLETCNGESAKRTLSMEVYRDTAKLCEFCAQEYEKSGEFADAAMAYKLEEMAYMRVIYLSNNDTSSDCRELQTVLQEVPISDDSPSSAASSVDNLNKPTTISKGSLVNGVGSPQVIGIHNIAGRNKPVLSRILNFAQVVNYAMESSRKCRAAFASATQGRKGLIKKVVDYTFHDVEELIRLVQLAM